jgi:hypothetical protein
MMASISKNISTLVDLFLLREPFGKVTELLSASDGYFTF